MGQNDAYGFVEVKNSYNYNNFSVREPYLIGSTAGEVNEKRKKCQRLVDEAIRQYKVAQTKARELAYGNPEELEARANVIRANFTELERTAQQIAEVKEWEDYVYRRDNPYDYDDDRDW